MRSAHWQIMRQPVGGEPEETEHVGAYVGDAQELIKKLQEADPYATYYHVWKNV